MKNQFFILLSVLVFGCQTNDNEEQANPNDPIIIHVDSCFDNADNGISVCLVSVTEDSRCPTGLVCVWAGDAVANFTIKTKNELNSFQLHTNNSFQTDTLLHGYRIILLSISSYPSTDSQIDQKDYSAEILVAKE